MAQYKVLFIMPTLEGGGAEKVLIDLLRNFNYEKYEVTLLLMRAVGEHISEIPVDVKVYELCSYLSKAPRYIVNRYTKQLWQKFRIRSLLRFRRFDSIVSFMEGEALWWHRMIIKSGKKNLTWVHIDLYANHWTERFFNSLEDEKQAYRAMDEIVCVSQQAQDKLVELLGNDLPRISVVWNIVDRDYIVEKSHIAVPRPKKFTVINIGRLVPQKRQDRLIRAIKILIERYDIKVDLWILGQGVLEKELRQLIQNLGLNNYVHLLGFYSNPYPFLKQADVLVSSSDNEGFSLVVAEAQCLGVPVISTKVTGPTELLSDGSGVLTDLSEEPLAEAIYLLYSNKNEYNKWSEASKRGGLRFQTKATMDKVYRVLDIV